MRFLLGIGSPKLAALGNPGSLGDRQNVRRADHDILIEPRKPSGGQHIIAMPEAQLALIVPTPDIGPATIVECGAHIVAGADLDDMAWYGKYSGLEHGQSPLPDRFRPIFIIGSSGNLDRHR